MKIYRGNQKSQGAGGQDIIVNEGDKDRKLSPGPSQKLSNHSVDGFNWGYGGSGPAQTALAILLDVTEDPERAQRSCQDFKWEYVFKWGERWAVSDVEILAWLEQNEAEYAKV